MAEWGVGVWEIMPFREHTEMKMIDVVINEKYATIYTQCVNKKGGENGNKR